MWTITALVSFALVFQFGILVEGQTASVDCGDDGIGMSINITDIPDLGLWTGADRDMWRLNNDTDCNATFGADSVTYGSFDATDCTTLTSTPNFFQYQFLINAAPVGSSPTRRYDHSYIIRCRYNRNGTVWSSFIPRHGLGLAADIPGVVAYFPLNSVYGAQEIENRTAEGTLNGVELAPGPDGNVGTSYQCSGTSSSFIEIPNTDGGLSVSGSITITLWVRPDAADDTGPLFQYYNDTSNETGVTFAIVAGNLSARIDPGTNPITAPAPLVEDEWSHVAVSYDGSTGNVTLFVNGVIVVTLTISVGIDLTTLTNFPVFLGSIGSGGGHFEGRIARVRLFSEALTEEQVQNVRGFLDAEALQIRDLTFNMRLYDQSTYAAGDLITSAVPIPLETTIYVRVSIAHQLGVGVDIFLGECYATPTQQGSDTRYNLIDHTSCDGNVAAVHESTVSYNCSSQTTETEDFSFKAFRYIGHQAVHLHCTLYVCRTDNIDSVCRSQCADCIAAADRKRRETGQFSDDIKYELTSGPYRFVDNEKAQTDTTEEREDHPSSNARLAVILAVSGGIAAIAVIVVIVAIIVRRKRRQQNITGAESPDIRM